VRRQPRELLRRVPGLTLVEMAESDLCCGSAGVYNLTHPETAAQLGVRKLDNAAATGAPTIVTANPGCLLQLQAGAARRGLAVQVRHVADVLDEAYGAEIEERAAPAGGRVDAGARGGESATSHGDRTGAGARGEEAADARR
jgi:glycolate oxidase iron-sulfur subunit